MQLYTQIYEFAASAGAFEGYVYRKTEADVFMLSRWVDHLVAAYRLLPPEARDQCDDETRRVFGPQFRIRAHDPPKTLRVSPWC